MSKHGNDDRLFLALINGEPEWTFLEIRGIIDRMVPGVPVSFTGIGTRWTPLEFRQEVLLSMYKAAQRGSIPYFGNFRGFTFRSIQHVSRNGWRTRNGTLPRSNPSDPDAFFRRHRASPTDVPDAAYFARETHDLFWDNLKRHESEENYCIMVLRFQGDLSFAEIEEMLELKPESAKARVYRIRKRLLARLGGLSNL